MINKILVVGGAGYIGSHIVDLLCEKGFDVTVFDNLTTGYIENLNKKAKFHKGDILNINSLELFLKNNRFDGLIHLAALKAAGESMVESEIYSRNNIIGSINLISASIKFKIKKFIFSSTAAVYGHPQYDPIDENHPTEPINHYGYTKLCVENYLSWMASQGDIKYIALRYFNAAGYSMKDNLIKYKEKKPQNLLPIVMEVANRTRKSLEIFGDNYSTTDGTCIRDYINVVDLADAHLKSLDYLDKIQSQSCSINLSTGVGHSVLDVVKVSESITKRRIPYIISDRREGDSEKLISTNHSAKKKLNWYPENSGLEQIIESMWYHYKD